MAGYINFEAFQLNEIAKQIDKIKLKTTKKGAAYIYVGYDSKGNFVSSKYKNGLPDLSGTISESIQYGLLENIDIIVKAELTDLISTEVLNENIVFKFNSKELNKHDKIVQKSWSNLKNKEFYTNMK